MKFKVLLLSLLVGSLQGFCQNGYPTITADSIGDGTFYISDKENWRFKAGDDLRWASPDYADSDWMQLTPSGMRAPIADSLWQGYGWFRFTFKADSSMYRRIWNLYFFTSGAAEVYIDGQLLNAYGTFATNPKNEICYTTTHQFSHPFSLNPSDYHVIAVRFSYHRGADYYKYLGKHAGYFGFGMGIENQEVFKRVLRNRDHALRALFISASMLLLMLILHSFLLILLPRDKSNRYIVAIVFLLFLHSFGAFSNLIVGMDALERFFVNDLFFGIIAMVAVALFPYAIATIFEQRIRTVHKIILGISPLIMPTILLTGIQDVYLFGSFVVVVMVFTVYLLFQAWLKKQKGLSFVAVGFAGALIVAMTLIFGLSSDLLSSFYFNLLITLFYVTIPLSMTLLMAYRFYLLNTGLEAKVVERTQALRQSLDSLKSTQAQLIHAEKMASLGELTAGIAHEIQNPLNFVNNFSEVSAELLDEMVEQLSKGELDEVKELSQDIRGNLEKITHHGKRADAIVKGMLAHSRSGKGEKTPTDINVLAEEYLKLSYHGLRAKDKNFNADFKTDFDPDLPKVNIVPQDIGRVLLNLINNAFQACASEGIEKPKVTVTTSRVAPPSGVGGSAQAIQVTVKDNGPGIPDSIKDKIFQPFFTTKPTGQGTGLGLSLSYDIVKAHGGTITVKSTENESLLSGQAGTEFTIRLPI